VASKPVKIYGGGWSRGFEEMEQAIILDLADVVTFGKVEFFNMDAPEGLSASAGADFQLIKIKWQDMGVPDLNAGFWYELADYILVQDKPVIACCVGGHGRTGTCLAILVSLFDLVPADKCPVQWLRLKYCYNAVETKDQIEYVKYVTGREVLAKQAKEPLVWSAIKSGAGRTWSNDDYKFNYGGFGY